MRIVIFEDSTHDDFYPLSLTRPLWDLRMGLFTFSERIVRLASREFPDAAVTYRGRDALAELCRETDPGISYNEPLTGGGLLFGIILGFLFLKNAGRHRKTAA